MPVKTHIKVLCYKHPWRYLPPKHVRGISLPRRMSTARSWRVPVLTRLAVLFGLPFGLEIDMWSLGCILAELYMGQPLFFSLSKDKLLQRMVSVLGPMPASILQRGKFFQEYSLFTGKPQSSVETWAKLHTEMIGVRDPHFISFIAAILQYNPSDRLSVYDAFQHPFLAPEIATRYLLPCSQSGISGEQNVYPKVGISSQTYNLSPAVSVNISNNHLKGIDLLRHQTKTTSNMKLQYRGRSKSTDKVIAEVAPFVNQSEIRQSGDSAFPVEEYTSSREAPRIPAFQIPPINDDCRSSREVSIPFPTGQKNVLCYANDVKKPIAVPGEFANSLLLGRQHEKNLPNKVLNMYARYQCSPQACQSNTDGQSKSVDISNETHNQVDNQACSDFQELPSTSHKRFQELPSTSYKEFHSGLDSSKRTTFSCRSNFIKVKTIASNTVLQNDGKQTKDDVNEYVDGSLESQKIAGHGTDERKLSDRFGRDLKGGVCIVDTPVQNSEVVLTSLTESNNTTSDKVRSDARHDSVKMRTKMLNISNAEFEDTNNLQQSLKSRRKNTIGIDKGVLSQSNKCKDVASPLSRWENLKQMRTEALRKNKIDLDVQSKTHNTLIESKSDGIRVFSVKTRKQKSLAMFSKQAQVLSMTKQGGVSLSPNRVSPRSCTHSVGKKPFSKRQRPSLSLSGVSPEFHCSLNDPASTKPSSKKQRISLSPGRISPRLCSHSFNPVGPKTSSKQIKVSVSPSGVAHGVHCPSKDSAGTKVSLSLSEVSSGFYSHLKDLDGTKSSLKGKGFSQSASGISPAFNISLKNLDEPKLFSKRQRVPQSSSRLSPGCHSAAKKPVETKQSSKRQRDSQSSGGLSSGFQSHSRKSVGINPSSKIIRYPVGTKVSVSPSEASSGFHSILKDLVGTKLSSKRRRVSRSSSRLSPRFHNPSKDHVDAKVLSPRQAFSRLQRPSTNPVDTEQSSKRQEVSQFSSGKSTKSNSSSKKPAGIKSFSKKLKISPFASKVTHSFQSPSNDQSNSKPSSSPSTPANLAKSIAQLKSVTPVSPTEYKVLLLSEFPTPENQTVTPSTVCVQPSMSDRVNQNVVKLHKLADKISVSDKDGSESEGFWQEGSLNNREEDFLEDEVLLL